MVLTELMKETQLTGTGGGGRVGGFLSDDCCQSGHHNAQLRGLPRQLHYLPPGKAAEAIPTERGWPRSHLQAERRVHDTLLCHSVPLHRNTTLGVSSSHTYTFKSLQWNTVHNWTFRFLNIDQQAAPNVALVHFLEIIIAPCEHQHLGGMEVQLGCH